MFTDLGSITLRNGEKVSAGVVVCPDLDWVSRLKRLLGHKPNLYNWQISELVEKDLGLEARFFILHREEKPFANITTAERFGSGFFGHVWTDEADRKKGASSELMKILLEDCRTRGTQALFLGTGYDSVAFHFYRKYGFESLVEKSGAMALYTESPEAFDRSYFPDSEILITDFDWCHWPSSAALFAGNYPGIIRSCGNQLFGRQITEGPFLKLLNRILLEGGEKPCPAVVMECTETHAMAGFASHTPHPFWPRTTVVDLFCHPRYWKRADELLEALVLPDACKTLVYADEECTEKILVLESAGFRKTAVLRNMLAQGDHAIDVMVYERQ